MEIKDGRLIVKSGVLTISQKVPEVAVTSKLRAYLVPTDYRESGLFISVAALGEPEQVPACHHAGVRFVGELVLEPSPAARLKAAKQRKRDEVSSACQAAVAVLAQDYPEAEILSWPQQVAEAVSVTADANAEAPLLSAISLARGLDVSELANRVLQKMQAYAVASGALIGQRQRAEDLIDAAQDLEQVDAVCFEMAAAE